MSLIEKLGNTGRGLVLGVTLGGLTVLSCSKDSGKYDANVTSDSNVSVSREVYDEKGKNLEDVYSYDRFVRALGDERLEDIDIKNVKEEWDSMNQESRELFCVVYEEGQKKDPDMFNVIYRLFSKGSKEGNSDKLRQEYKEFDPSLLNLSEIKDYEEGTSWKLILDNKKISESEKMMLYLLHHLHKEPWEGPINSFF